MTTISVIVATYGDEEWAHLAHNRAEHSVVYQDDVYEFIIRHEPEGSRATSLNNSAAAATGDWLIFLDADDELAPGYMGAMRRALERNPDGKQVLFTPAAQWIRRGQPRPPAFQTECDLRKGNWLVIGTMINRAFFLELGGFRDFPHGTEDWNLWARAVRAGATIVKVPAAVYIAHVNPQSKHHQLARNRRAWRAAHDAAYADAWG